MLALVFKQEAAMRPRDLFKRYCSLPIVVLLPLFAIPAWSQTCFTSGPPGSVIYTKSGGVHGIRNPGSEPLKFVAFLYHTT